jgi:hypothetical protein
MQMSIALWTAIGAVAVAMGLLMFIRPKTGLPDLGSVSEQWIAQHRAGRDLQR